MDFFDTVLSFGLANLSTLKPLGDRALDLGVQIWVENRDGARDISRDLSHIRTTGKEMTTLARQCTEAAGGSGYLTFAGRELFRMQFDGEGNHKIHLRFLEGKARDFFAQMGPEIARFREAFLSNYSDEDLFDMIDISAEFLAGLQGETFSYTLFADNKPFLEGVLEGSDFNVQLLDPLVYLKTLLFVMEGANFLNVKLTSPLDLMKLFERLQGALRHLSNAFKAAGLKIQAGVVGEAVFKAGRDVKPNLTSAFGPVNIQLDSLFRIVSSVLSKI